MVDVHHLPEPSEAQVEEMTQFLLRAHEGIPLIDVTTDARESVKRLWFRMGILITAIAGKIWVVYDPIETGLEPSGRKIVSAIFGFGPGAMPMASEAQRAVPEVAEFRNALSPEAGKWQSEVFEPAVKKMTAESIGAKKIVDNWLPIMVGTDPDYQRRGYATALMHTLQKQAHADHTDVVLATFSDELAAYYSSLGFETKGQVDIESPRGNWAHRLMLWEDNLPAVHN